MSEENKKKNKKINKMSLEEIEQSLDKSVEKMGGADSRYIKHLKDRREEILLKNKK